MRTISGKREGLFFRHRENQEGAGYFSPQHPSEKADGACFEVEISSLNSKDDMS